jgi:hypothetical protein
MNPTFPLCLFLLHFSLPKSTMLNQQSPHAELYSMSAQRTSQSSTEAAGPDGSLTSHSSTTPPHSVHPFSFPNLATASTMRASRDGTSARGPTDPVGKQDAATVDNAPASLPMAHTMPLAHGPAGIMATTAEPTHSHQSHQSGGPHRSTAPLGSRPQASHRRKHRLHYGLSTQY